MSIYLKNLLLLGTILLVYGYVCRALHLDLFWESKDIGWTLLFCAGIVALRHRCQVKRKQGRKRILENIGIFALGITILVQILTAFLFPNTDAYSTAKKYLSEDQGIKTEVGTINSINLRPFGSMEYKGNDGVVTGNAVMSFIVKGEKHYKEVDVYIQKTEDSPWTVVGIN